MNALPPLPTRLPPKLDQSVLATSGKQNGANGDTGPDEDNGRIYYLDPAEPVEDDTDEEELNFEEVPVEEFQESSEDEEEETLEHAVRSINEKAFFGVTFETPTKAEELTPSLTKRPEVIDDYIRNFLSSKGLVKSLDAFQNEWYEFQQKAALSPEDTTVVPDVYQRNQELADALQKLRIDVENYKDIASKARSTYDKLRKERDFHRMHHKRVVQEKNKLIGDIKRLKKHYESYEPTLKQLQHKYEVAMKEKMLTKLERDRLAGRVVSLESTVRTMEKNYKDMPPPSRLSTVARPKDTTTGTTAPTTSQPQPGKKVSNGSREATLPAEDRPNPYMDVDLPTAKTDRLRQIHMVRAHDLAVSAIKFHPKKQILATVSDDKTWKMWAFPSGELIMSGSGHRDWIADCDFHPRGAHLATASGDTTVKIWDFSKGSASLTLTDHTQAVWSCAFHDTGDFLATASMDHTAKLFDLHTGRCRQTFRGHADSVNHVGFQPYTNTVVTCSGDKTISLWDARTGLCAQTLYGHTGAVNDVAFTSRAETLYTISSDGTLKTFDTRACSELTSLSLSPHPLNKLSLDPSGSVCAIACNDGSVKIVTNHGRGSVRELKAHDDAVQTVAFDRGGEFLVSGGSGE
ncbi:Sperm-associated antigen 16 protein [Rhizophlyctis rosea]|nr:Sperm-associated antigen 16 protein [Rhizophlyctis rosea]